MAASQEKISLVRCFCGCSQLSIKDVERIALSKIDDFLRDEMAMNLFRQYIKSRNIKHSQALKYLNTYEMCKRQSDEDLESLWGHIPYSKECDLKRSLAEQDTKQTRTIFLELQSFYKHKFEIHRDYEHFRTNLCDKLKVNY